MSAYGVGHATSTDGIHWASLRGAGAIAAAGERRSGRAGGAQPSVIYDAVHCRWELWQTSDATGETDAQPIVFNNMAGVWHATSIDGVTWTIDYSGHARPRVERRRRPRRAPRPLTGADVAVKDGGRYMMYGAFDDQNVQRVLPAR